MQKIFISYPRDNPSGQKLSRELFSHLKRRQIGAFFDKDGIVPGARWLDTLKSAVAESRIMLWVVSGASDNRKWQEAEFFEAEEQGLTVIPVLAEECTIPMQVKGNQAIFLYGERKQQELEKLLDFIEQQLGIDQIKPLRQDAIKYKQNERYDLAIQKWEQILQLEPDHRQVQNEIEYLRQLRELQQKGQSLGEALYQRCDDIESVFFPVKKVLNSAAKHPDAATVMEYTQRFLDNKSTATQYVRLCEQLFDQPRRSTGNQTNYAAFSQRLLQGEIALFLGSGLAQTYSEPGNADTSSSVETELLRQLADSANFNDFNGSFSAIAEYYRLNRDFGEQRFLTELRQSLDYSGEAISLYQLLGRVDEPLILISSAYDDALERSFDTAGKPYVELTSLLNRCAEHDIGHLVVRYSNREKPEVYQPTDEQVSKFRWYEDGYSLIFNIRGTCHNDPGRDYQRETLTVTESDYFNFARYADKVIPDYLANQLKYKGLLFAGFNPGSWEERLLVNALLTRRKKVMADEAPRAVGQARDALEAAYWQEHQVEHDMDLRLLDESLEVLL